MTKKGEEPMVPVRTKVLWMVEAPGFPPDLVRAVEITDVAGKQLVSERWHREKRCWLPTPGLLGAPASMGACFIEEGDPEEVETLGHSISAPAVDWSPGWREDYKARRLALQRLLATMEEPGAKRHRHTTINEDEREGSPTKATLSIRHQGFLRLSGGDGCGYWLIFRPPHCFVVLRLLAEQHFGSWWREEWEFCHFRGLKEPAPGWETASPPFSPEFTDFLWAAAVEYIKGLQGDCLRETEKLCEAQGIPFERTWWDDDMD